MFETKLEEDMIFWQLLNIFFFIIHICLILFNVFGWIYKPLRKYHLTTVGLTIFSWVVLGIFYGFGYCFLTDWHWEVREKLGYINESNSYIHFLVLKITGINFSKHMVDVATVSVFALAVVLSIALSIRDSIRR